MLNKKAQAIAMTFSDIVQFIFVFFIMLGLVVAGAFIFSGNNFSKNSIDFYQEYKGAYSVENQRILINLLEAPCRDNKSVRESIIEFFLSDKKVLDEDVEKNIREFLKNNSIEEYFLEISSKDKKIEIVSGDYANFYGAGYLLQNSGSQISSVYIFSKNKINVELIYYENE